MENGQRIHLDEPLPTPTKRVSVIVKPTSQKAYNGEAFFAWLEKLHERRKQLGIKSLTKEEVDAWIQEERDSWGD
ncbi:hypothetical protein L0337_35605 [candidate division KSB1 bacterium]|nr:hypothetical protein [candidate division KSB1 bacterium]